MATKSKAEVLDELGKAAEAFLSAKGKRREQLATELRIAGDRWYRALREAGPAKQEKKEAKSA